jgi:putative IMPACT (imprinted ancient) family translation regulator
MIHRKDIHVPGLQAGIEALSPLKKDHIPSLAVLMEQSFDWKNLDQVNQFIGGLMAISEAQTLFTSPEIKNVSVELAPEKRVNIGILESLVAQDILMNAVLSDQN